jgi:hypothetical protein
MYSSVILGFVALLLCAATFVCAQPPPKIPLDANQQPLVYTTGFRRPNDTGAGRVRIEMHFDMSCRVCRGDWQNVMSVVLSKYSMEDVSAVLLPFPLSAHRAGFPAAKAGFVLESMLPKQNVFFSWMETMFNNQDPFQNPMLLNKTDLDIVNMLADVAAPNFKVDRAEFVKRMLAPFQGPTPTPDLSDFDMLTRSMWKMSASQSISGTPMYVVNGVRLLCDSWTVDQWTTLLDFMLAMSP